MRRLSIAAAAALTLAPFAPSLAGVSDTQPPAGTVAPQPSRAELEQLIAPLPPGQVKSVLLRLPDDELRTVIDAARPEISALDLRRSAGTLSPDAHAAQLEQAVGVRAALIIAASRPTVAATTNPALKSFLPSEFLTAAYSRAIGQSLIGSSLASELNLETVERMLGYTPYVHKPAKPCNEMAANDPRRLSICVDRDKYNSVAGLAWAENGGLVIECSGQFLSATVIVTADHCFLNHGATKPTVLTHYTGGTSTAIRRLDGQQVQALSVHAVKAVYRASSSPNQKIPDLRDNDIAVIELSSPAPVQNFPKPAQAYPSPPRMTMAGWGLSDAAAVRNVALEVTIVEPNASSLLVPEPPTLRTWPATLVSGGGICRGDSGGPVFAGDPVGKNPSSLPLLGLVAGGNLNCKGGRQALTDLTQPQARLFVCAHAAGTRFCS
jgi:hypothetical protein